MLLLLDTATFIQSKKSEASGDHEGHADRRKSNIPCETTKRASLEIICEKPLAKSTESSAGYVAEESQDHQTDGIPITADNI